MEIEEKWRSIPGYEMLYEVSNLGRIRTCEGKVTSNARFPHRVWKQRILKQKCTRNVKGRYDFRVCLWKDGEEKTFLVARLVALAFCDGYTDGMTVNHIDGNPLNNNASKLEWCSLEDNIRRGFRDGLYSTQKQVSIIDPDGIEHTFASRAAASRFLGRGNSYISTMIGKNKLSLPGGYMLKPA